jgi:ferrochelatase
VPKNIYRGNPGFKHGEVPAVGVLLANLGTPEAPTAKALRPYLREFLSDPRVIEMSRPLWWLILNLVILPFRPRKSAQLYQAIWTEEGSPLLVISRRIEKALAAGLKERVGSPLHVELGMGYGQPSIVKALAALQAKGCRKILVLPLFPHYSSTSTGAVFDTVMKELMTWRVVPEMRTIHSFHDEPGLIKALATSIRELWDKEGEPDKLVLSYHGIPLRYFLDGDPYHCLCYKTTRLLTDELGLSEDQYVTTFQSLFGKEEWIKPPTDGTLAELPGKGTKRVDVICPGFSFDCLETLEEIDGENRKIFMDAGGERFRYIPCLNDRADHVGFLTELAMKHLGGWVVDPESWDGEAEAAKAKAAKERAEVMRAAKGY